VNEQILPIPKATLPLVIFNSHWLLPKRLYNLITVAGQCRIYAGLSPFLPKGFFVGTDFCTFMRLSQLWFVYKKNFDACQQPNK
jgi:hypothetical protein